MQAHFENDTIFVEDARILAHQAFAGDQYWMQVEAPECAQRAKPGAFAHIRCHPLQAMRRPLSIMRTSVERGLVEFLYKAVGEGTRLLSQRKVGECINMMGPIGQPFSFDIKRPRLLLIGGGVGIPPMTFIAETCRQLNSEFQPLALFGSEVPFPFQTEVALSPLPGVSESVNRSADFLNQHNIPGRLASLEGYEGCYQGYVTDLARQWLEALSSSELDEVQIMACGPHPMLNAVAQVAKDYDLPCQLSLEEYMACAVGGCAGCVVPVETAQGKAMKRVCVDGPVFEAREVFADVFV